VPRVYPATSPKRLNLCQGSFLNKVLPWDPYARYNFRLKLTDLRFIADYSFNSKEATIRESSYGFDNSMTSKAEASLVFAL
jgi:hypothetical protein